MVGVIVEDMPRALEFYRRLGVEFPEGSEDKQHVEVKMGNMTFFLNHKALNAKWDPSKTEPAGGYRIILEFYLKTIEAVDSKFAEMTGYGYKAHQTPFYPNTSLYFAMIDDPDGNTILLSAFKEEPAQA
jgi:predicted lactoylglutathione lyase